MKHALNEEEHKRLNERTAAAEKKTNAQIVCAVIGKSDTYAELPWKAFALGVSLAGLAALLLNILRPPALPWQSAFSAVGISLGAGAGAALAVVFIPAFARLFLSVSRADTEVRQYADSLFLSREMFAVPRRRAVLLLVSLFERRIVVLPDAGLVRQLDAQAASAIIRSMRPELIAGRTAQALETGVAKIEELLLDDGRPAAENTLPDDVIEEEGT